MILINDINKAPVNVNINGIEVTNIVGKVVVSKGGVGTNATDIEIGELPAGNYLVSVITADAVTTQVIEKNN